MPAIGAEVADAYIEVHADTGPFRRELRREATLAAREASDEFGTEFTKAIDRDLSPLGARVAESLREAGELGGRSLIEEVADQVRSRADRINTAFAESVTFGDFSPFIEQFNDLDTAIEDFDTRLRDLNRDGTLTNETFDRLNASFNAYVRTLQDSAIADALSRDREEAVALENASDRLTTSLGRSDEAARRFNIGLGSLRGSRNDFLNFIGTLSGFLERNIGTGLASLFQNIGNGVSSLGERLSAVNGPLGAVGQGLEKFGGNINKLGAGGLDGLLVQIAALIIGLQLLVAAVGPVAAALSGMAAAATALAVGVGGALLGGILALGPGLAALAAGAGAVTIAFSDLSDAQKDVFNPLQNLFNEVRTAIQGRLFDGLGGQVDSLVNALTPLGPFLTTLAGVFSDWVSDVVGEIGPNGPLAATFQSLGADLPGIFRTLLDLVSAVGGSLTGLFAGAGPGAQRLFEGITGVVEQFSAWVNTAAGQQAINDFMQQAVDILTLLWEIAQQVGVALGELWGGGAQQGAQQLLTLVRDLVTSFAEWLGDPANREQLLAFFRNGVLVAQGLGGVIGALVGLFRALDTDINRLIVLDLLGFITGAIGAFTQFATTTQNVLNAVGRFVNQVIATSATVRNFASSVVASGRAFLTGLGGAFTSVGNFIQTLITRFLSLRSPMEIVAASGRNLRTQLINAFNSVVNGLNTLLSRGRAALGNLASAAGSLAGQAARALLGLAANASLALARFVSSIQNGISNALGALGRFAGQAVAALGNLASRFFSAGGDIMRGLYNGVVSAAGAVLSYISGLASDVAATFASVLGISSPSKVFRELGGFTIDGFIQGMERRKKAAEDEAGTVAEGVINSAIQSLSNQQDRVDLASQTVFEALARAGRNPALNKAFQQLGNGLIVSLTNGLSRGRESAADDVKDIIERIGSVARNAMEGEDKRTRTIIARQAEALRDWVRGQAAALDAVWREVDQAGVRLDNARKRLQELQEEYAQLRAQTRDALTSELDLSAGIGDDGTATFESVASQVSGLAARMKKFAGLIKQLIKAGFPPALVQEVAALGTTDGIAVANALLSGTQAQQADLINDFQSINTAASAIGTALAEQMFRAGVDAQKGLIAGLEANQAALIKAAKRIAKTITDEIKRELGIKSPSTVFRQLGEFIVEGLALGIESGTDRVANAVTGLVDPSALNNINAPISSLASQTAAATGGGAAVPGVPGGITVVTPYANPRLVAIEVMDALAARGK